MAIYDSNGQALSEAFDANGQALSSAYDADGNIIFNNGQPLPWEDEITVQTLRDSPSNTTYYVIRVPQIRGDGSKQYPFVRVPNDKYTSDYGRTSALKLAQDEGWNLTINAGLGNGVSLPIDGVAIENSVIKHADIATYHVGAKPITINRNGMLGYATAGTNANTLLSLDMISAVCGFFPIILNGVPCEITDVRGVANVNAQRQIIGQFENGDYCIVTCEGRNFANSTGWTMAQAQTICQNLGLEFAYNLDGGGSTETVIGTEQLNTIYEGTTGRIVPSFIVFNGTDQFFIPNES